MSIERYISPIKVEPKNVALNIRISKTDKEKLKKLAKALRTNEAEVVRRAIYFMLEEIEKGK